MKAVWIITILAIVGLEYFTITGAPVTKWFKTDNNTYYIETQQIFTFQQSYDECHEKNLGLISLKSYKEDALLTEYLKQVFENIPEFWLKSSDLVDMNDINKFLASIMTEQFLNIKMDGSDNIDVLHSNDPGSCALSSNGTGKACETLHGFICKDNNAGSSGQNVQNIVLKFT